MSKKIKIVFAINNFSIGGAQRLYLDIFKTINHNVFDLHLITLFQPREEDFYELVPPYIRQHKVSFKSFLDINSWWKLARILVLLKPRVVISSLFFSNTVMRMLKIFFGYKIIIIEHNTYIYKGSLHIFVDRILSRLTCKIIAVSESVKKFTIKQERIKAQKFIVINNGIDINRISKIEDHYSDITQLKRELGFSSNLKTIINVGRLAFQKNQKLLINAFAEFVQKNNDYILIIIGQGSLKNKLLAQIKELSLDKKVFLLGAKRNIIPYYLISDFFISTSLIEGFGIAAAEALCCGLPILSTKTAGIDEMIKEGQNGFFIKKAAPKSVARDMEKMVDFLESVNRDTIIKSAGHFAIEKTVQEYENLILECISKKQINL